VGTAVTRNRVRRRLRAIVASHAAELPPGDLMVLVRPAAADLAFSDLEHKLCTAAARLPSTSRSSS
jgi:ribonuclease P protein component